MPRMTFDTDVIDVKQLIQRAEEVEKLVAEYLGLTVAELEVSDLGLIGVEDELLRCEAENIRFVLHEIRGAGPIVWRGDRYPAMLYHARMGACGGLAEVDVDGEVYYYNPGNPAPTVRKGPAPIAQMPERAAHLIAQSACIIAAFAKEPNMPRQRKLRLQRTLERFADMLMGTRT